MGSFTGKCYDYFSQTSGQGMPHSSSLTSAAFPVNGDENFQIPRVEYPTLLEPSDRLLIHSVLLELANLIQKAKEENIFNFLIRALILLSNRFRGEIASKTLIKVLSALFKAFHNTKSPTGQNQLRVLIQQFTVTKFDKINLSLEFLHTQSINNVQKYLSFDSMIITDVSTPVKTSPGSKQKGGSDFPEDKEINEELQSKLKSRKITPIDLYCHAFLTNLFDDVCLFDAKSRESNKEGSETSEGLEFKKRLTIEVSDEEPIGGGQPVNAEKDKKKQKNSIRSVPVTFCFENPGSGVRLEKPIRNEIGRKNGLFGWCFTCRSAANYYCKETRVPICGAACKLKHLAEIDRCGKFYLEQEQNRRYLESQVEDACILLRKLERLSILDPHKKWRRDHRIQILILEILLEAFDTPGFYIRTKPEVIGAIKLSIFPALIRLCFSSEKETCRLSLSVFIIMVKWFRVHLKSEFRVFVEEIFNKILISGNSFYTHKILALHALQNLVQKPSFALEIFLNYDCDVEQKNIFENILALMCKIAQGMYTRMDYAASISETQEQDMKAIALDSIVNLVSNLHQIMFSKGASEAILEEEGGALKPKQGTILITETENDASSKVRSEKIPLDDVNPAKRQQIQRRTKGKNFEDLAESMNTKKLEGGRQKKSQISKAISLFNSKIKHGIRELVKLGVFKEEYSYFYFFYQLFIVFWINRPREVAYFLFTTKGLAKNKIGELLASEEKFFNDVLREYADLLCFKDISIDDAMRAFLQLFEMPGEGQQVERIVNAFAFKFAADNPSFITYDASSLLSFLLMMLQTDAHNPQVKEKMKLSEFLKLGLGIKNNEESLGEAYLTSLYHKVIKSPLALPEREHYRKQLQESVKLSKNHKKEIYRRESFDIIEKTTQILSETASSKPSSKWLSADLHDYLLPFIESSWTTFLVVFSVCFDMNDDPVIIKKCLNGLGHVIKILNELNMETEKETFINSLEKFSALNSMSSMKMKNLLCLKITLKFAGKNGNSIGTSWVTFLALVSRIDYFFEVAQRLPKNELQILTNPINKVLGTKSMDEQKSELIVSAISQQEIDRIFTGTSSLGESSLLSFVSALCRVSKLELDSGNFQRTFSLKKITYVAEINLHRRKIVWTRVWNLLKVHFEEVCLVKNTDLSILAIDLLRQLVSKFLERVEESQETSSHGFDYNDNIFDQFNQIYKNNPMKEVRLFVLSCLASLVQNNKKKLGNGLKTLLEVCQASLDEYPIETHKLFSELAGVPLKSDSQLEDMLEFVKKTFVSRQKIFAREFTFFIKKASVNSRESVQYNLHLKSNIHSLFFLFADFMSFLIDESSNGLEDNFDALFGYNLILTLALETQNGLFELLDEKMIQKYIALFNDLVVQDNSSLSAEEETLIHSFAENIGKIHTSLPEWNPAPLMNMSLEYLLAKSRFCQRIGLIILKELINEKTSLMKETVDRIYKIIQASKSPSFFKGYASWKEIFRLVTGSITHSDQQISENEVLNSLVVLKKLGLTNSPHINHELTQNYISSALASTRLQWCIDCLKHKNPVGTPSVIEQKCLSVSQVYMFKTPEGSAKFIEDLFFDWSFIIQQRQLFSPKSPEKSPFLNIFVPINFNLVILFDKVLLRMSLKGETLQKTPALDCFVDLLVRNALIENQNSDLAAVLIKISSKAIGVIGRIKQN